MGQDRVKRARVYHLRDYCKWAFRFNEAKWPEDYELVAGVTGVSDLETIYMLTNNIDRVWWENPGVFPYFFEAGVTGCRSTSVGDVIVTEAGAFRVAECGFERVQVEPLTEEDANV